MLHKDYDQLVGGIALANVRAKYLERISEEDFDGGFHVLSGFTPKQLAGFAWALRKDNTLSAKVHIRFPASFLATEGLPQKFLTEKSTVDVRNRDYGGCLVIAAELEKDAGASLAECDRTDIEDIRNENLAEIWVDVLCTHMDVDLIDDARKHLIAAIKGLFQTARSTPKTTCQFICQTLSHYDTEGQIIRAAGLSLPTLGLPLWHAFNIPLPKAGQPSAWRDAFLKHAERMFYLWKRDTKNVLLDIEDLRKRHRELLEQTETPLPDTLLDAFRDYIDSNEQRSDTTERLLFEFDWDDVQHCFDRAKKTTAAGFIKQTRQALQGDGIQPTDEDEALLEQWSQRLPKTSDVSDLQRGVVDFFDRYVSAISENPRLLSQWESIIYGTKVSCTNLLEGIISCLERVWNDQSPGHKKRLRLVGKKQSTPNQLKDRNPDACEYFERNYADLPRLTSGYIHFQNSIVIEYSKSEHQEWRRVNGVKKSAAIKANTLEFQVILEESGQTSDDWIEVGSSQLDWRFKNFSILAEEGDDIKRLAKILEAPPKTALIEGQAYYESTGRKGAPLSAALDDTQGLSDTFGAGGRGSLIPAIHRASAYSLQQRWDAAISSAERDSSLSAETLKDISRRFDTFRESYDELIPLFAQNALLQNGVRSMVTLYRELILALCALPHEAVRRQLLRIVLSIGNVRVEKSGSRPLLAIVCPWHPLRMEAAAARYGQFRDHLLRLLDDNPSSFSDDNGKLFFSEFSALLNQPLYPEVTVAWDTTEPVILAVSQALCDYTLHEPMSPEDETSLVVQDNSKEAAKQIEQIFSEFLRLQPHERNNLSVALYDCDSASLPAAVVAQINAFNDNRKDDEVTCQVYLMHRNDNHLREVYRELVAVGGGTDEGSPTEATGDILSKVRVNIVAAKSIGRTDRSEPIDIVYCRDLVSRRAKPTWVRRPKIVVSPDDLQPHQWSRRLPAEQGIKKASLQLCCPAMTEAGWTHLYAIASLLTEDAKDAWEHEKCPVPMKILDFDLKEVQEIFRGTHQLATWVVNQDEILDRRLLEAQDVKVIRYVQSSTQGRNLVISSTASELLLHNTLKEKLRDILFTQYPADQLPSLARLITQEANHMSGGLVLKAARRVKNTNELLGMVLSRFIVRTEIGFDQPAAWCFLDDYATWLGKKDGTQIADLLVLVPTISDDGIKILDIVVTEAKFINGDGFAEGAKRSERQLRDSLRQLEEALLAGEPPSLDQDVWLSRISDMLLSRLDFSTGRSQHDLDQWRSAIRNRQCKIRIRGYSHVFVYAPSNFLPVDTKIVAKTRNGVQEVFTPALVKELILALATNNLTKLRQIRDFSVLDAIDQEPKDMAAAAPVNAESHNVENGEHKAPDDETPTQQSNVSITSADTTVEIAPEVVAPDSIEKTSDLISYLEQRARSFSSSKEEGLAWLKQTGTTLRNAFLARQLPCKAADGYEPILTPNAGIFRLRGSANLTVPIVESKAQEIYTSEGIQIIAVTPEPGRLRLTIAKPERETLYTETVLRDFLTKHREAATQEQLLTGIREEDGEPLIFNPYDQPHTLIAGSTGSGKSVLMQNIILSIAATRSPDESKIFLIDPKYGVDYISLQDLPHIQAGSNGIIDNQEDALEVLNQAVAEMERRYQLFKQCGRGVGDIRTYRRVTGESLPTWWLFHDEFADWMQTDHYREEVPKLVNRLSVKARAAGVFLVFAAQRPDNTVFPIQMRDQLGNRLILKVQSVGTSEIALGTKGAERLLGKGHMLARLGGESEPIFAQVPFIDSINAIPPLAEIITAQWDTTGKKEA